MLDAAVFASYGWPTTLTDAEILERLVALNAERAAEEKTRHHPLPPSRIYRIKAVGGGNEPEPTLDLPKPEKPKKSKAIKAKAAPRKQEWPKTLAARVQAIEAALHRATSPLSADDLAKQFSRAKSTDILEILETLAAMGRAHRKGSSYTK